MYKGESVRGDGFRFFGSCSGLIFSNLVLIFLSPFSILIRSNTCLQRIIIWCYFRSHNYLKTQVTCLIFWVSVCSEKNLSFHHFTSMPSSPPWKNWKLRTETMPRALLYQGHWILSIFTVEKAQYLFLPVFFSRICDGLDYCSTNIKSLATPAVGRVNFLALLILGLKT